MGMKEQRRARLSELKVLSYRTCFPGHSSLRRLGKLESSRLKRFNQRMSLHFGPMNYGKFQPHPGNPGSWSSEGNPQKGITTRPIFLAAGEPLPSPFLGILAKASHSCDTIEPGGPWSSPGNHTVADMGTPSVWSWWLLFCVSTAAPTAFRLS